MKKIIILFILLLSISFAVDMAGKVGMGIGTKRFGDLLKPTIFSLRIGVLSELVLEPWLDISSLKFTVNYPKTEELEEREYDTSFTNKGIGLEGLYALKSEKKTNLYGILGIYLGRIEIKYESKTKEEKTSNFAFINYWGIPLGIGGEYFLNNHFSVNLNMKIGFMKASGKNKLSVEATEKLLKEYSIFGYNISTNLFTVLFNFYF
ncbi:MAG: hypothetical protein ABIK77_06695 [candidate division WOR-3 bacterium]|uniref:Outer membrane protein beta-barrel domain-containing protein n=1 Tax=candidate division WOR-3 bacterium TaxID=2052148 RepID=A0A7V4CI58_UNCW3